MKSIVNIFFALTLLSCNKSENTPVASVPEICKDPVEAVPAAICDDNGGCAIREKESDVISLEPCPNQLIPPGWECNSKKCWATEPKREVPTEHERLQFSLYNDPRIKGETSDMFMEFWLMASPELEQQEVEEIRAKSGMVSPDKEKVLRRFISRNDVTNLKPLMCRYIKQGPNLRVEAFWDSDLQIFNGVSIISGIFPVLEGSDAAVVKTLLPVEGGYIEAYIDSTALTNSTEQAANYKLQGEILDTAAPELCPTKWPHAHHWPLHL